MGLISSRLNLDGLNAGRRRSHQDETLYSYSLNKNYFSNYFLMGGERFEVNDPDYLFGDNCDLNFLSCTKPCSLPYKQAQQNLLSILSTKQKAINKVSSRVNRLSSPFNIFSGHRRQTLNSRKQDSHARNLYGSKNLGKGSEASQPLVMLVNIRKETLRLVKSSIVYNPDSDINSLTNSVSTSEQKTGAKSARKLSGWSKQSKKSLPQQQSQATNRHSAASSRATTSTIHPNEINYTTDDESGEIATSNFCSKKLDSDIGSLVSATSSIRSGYASIKEDAPTNSSSEDDDEDFEDALNDTTNLSINDDNNSEKTQQQRSLLSETKENRDIKITIEPLDDINNGTTSDTKTNSGAENQESDENSKRFSGQQNSQTKRSSSTRRLAKLRATDDVNVTENVNSNGTRVYNIEFEFDSDVDCSIRIFYFCTREITTAGISYKPQHATYKSKIYYYKKGLNQKFDQQEHTFQPYLFDEDLLIYKPLDLDGNYNSGAVFPIVIQCVALEGSNPRQSQSLVATIEKSQLDDSYSIKPLKQLIFVDGVQYILQDIYGIENKPFISGGTKTTTSRTLKNVDSNTGISGRSNSLQSSLNESNLNLSDTASVASVNFSLSSRQNRGSLISNNRVKSNDNSSECVICMSDGRDTMLLPCRHLCLCSACAQSLRYQASSCPICRCPFKAALNLRPTQRLSHSSNQSTSSSSSTATKALHTGSTPTVSTSLTSSKAAKKSSCTEDDSMMEREKDIHLQQQVNRKGSNQVLAATTANGAPSNRDSQAAISGNYDDLLPASRRESVTTSATPLLSAPLDVVVSLDGNGSTSRVTTIAASTPYHRSNSSGVGGGFTSSNTRLLRQMPTTIDSSAMESSSSTTNVAAVVVVGDDDDDYEDGCPAAQGLGESAGGSLEMRTMNVHWRPSSKEQ